MRICSLISHMAIGCGGLIGGWLVAVGQLGILPSFAQALAASSGQRSTELFNRVMDDVLGRRLTVRLTERDPGNGSAAVPISSGPRNSPGCWDQHRQGST